MANNNESRALPDGSFCGAGVESLRLPPDFHFIGPKACENCKRLIEVDLMCTDITAIWGSTFSYCVALVDIWLPLLHITSRSRRPTDALVLEHSAAVSSSHSSLN